MVVTGALVEVDDPAWSGARNLVVRSWSNHACCSAVNSGGLADVEEVVAGGLVVTGVPTDMVVMLRALRI